MEYHSRVRASLLAGAMGDALGYSVEFDTYKQIIRKYGKDGICDLVCEKGKKAVVSDDTQMTLFTLEGLLHQSEDPIESIYESYLEWLNTQIYDYDFICADEKKEDCLRFEKRLYVCRAPGNTCISALDSKIMGRVDHPINDSMGCGGVMRVAPIAYYYAKTKMPVHKIALLGVDCAALTHSHPLSHISTYFFTTLLVKLLRESIGSLQNTVLASLKNTIAMYKDNKYINKFENMIKKAIVLSSNEQTDVKAICMLGEGWIAPETVAIALYAFMKYPTNLKKALIASSNHDGDSDSTASICGQLVGAYVGEEGLDSSWIKKLEMVDVMDHLLNKLKEIS